MQERPKSHFLSSLIFFVLVGAGAFFYWKVMFPEPCVKPITYRIGTLDTQFGLSRTDFLLAIEQGSSVWEDAIGKELFVPDAKGKLVVNLIYDERQAETQNQLALENQIDDFESNYKAKRASLETLKANYERAVSEYEQMAMSFKAASAQYQSQVVYWNRRGGAPKSEYEELSRQKQELLVFQQELESKRLALNEFGAAVNALVAEVNQLAQATNNKVREYNSSGLIGVNFDQGLYVRDASGTSINIYQFTDHEKLVRVLAHEFGHALGLDHNDNPASIMYRLNKGDTEDPSPDDISDLKTLCKVAS